LGDKDGLSNWTGALKTLLSGDGAYDRQFRADGKARARPRHSLRFWAASLRRSAASTLPRPRRTSYKSAASSYAFRSDMAAINARSAENEAQSILEAGKSQVQQYTMRAGQEKASTTARTAAHGVALGVGSTRDVAASQDVVKDIDMMTINSNATRAALAARTQATNYKNESLLDNVSSQNMLRSSRSISPFDAAGFTSLLGQRVHHLRTMELPARSEPAPLKGITKCHRSRSRSRARVRCQRCRLRPSLPCRTTPPSRLSGWARPSSKPESNRCARIRTFGSASRSNSTTPT
jgi:hypothetical protein